jgi:hypothetical protein
MQSNCVHRSAPAPAWGVTLPADPSSTPPTPPHSPSRIVTPARPVPESTGPSTLPSNSATHASDRGPSKHSRLGARRMLMAWGAVLALTGLAALLSLTSALDVWLLRAVYHLPTPAPSGGWWDALWLPIVAGLLLIWTARLHGGQVLALVGSMAVLGLGLDALLAVTGVPWGAGGWLVMLTLVAAISWMQERRRALHGLSRLERWLAGRAQALSAQDCATDRDVLFRQHFSVLSDQYLSGQHFAASSGLLADLAPGSWHLDFRGFHHVHEEDIEEMRRDIRRMPYAESFASGRAMWAEDYMAPELAVRSLLMPLLAGSQPVGLWVINVPARSRPDDAWLDLVHRLAKFLALSLHRRAAAALPPPPTRLMDRLFAPERTVPEVVEVSRLVEAVTSAHTWLHGLLEDAPVGLLAASLWGEVLFANRAIREALVQAGAGEPVGQELTHLIMALTGMPHAEVMARLRDLLINGQPWPFRALTGRVQAMHASANWVLSYWSPPGTAPEERRPAESMPHRLVLTLAPSTTAPVTGLVPVSSRGAMPRA